MEEIYEEATQGFEVPEAIAARIRELIRDAWDLEIHISGSGVFVEALPQPPYGVLKVLGRFNSLLSAQNFAWAWLTGAYGVVGDVRFIETAPRVLGLDIEFLVEGIREYLTEKVSSVQDAWVSRSDSPLRQSREADIQSR